MENVAGDRQEMDMQAMLPGSLSFLLRATRSHEYDLRRGNVGFEFQADNLAVSAQVEF